MQTRTTIKMATNAINIEIIPTTNGCLVSLDKDAPPDGIVVLLMLEPQPRTNLAKRESSTYLLLSRYRLWERSRRSIPLS